jgi:hypothetical protein
VELKVHYHLASLHGMDRFPEIVPNHEHPCIEDRPSHDIFSVIFHLSHAASLYNVPACLALARARVGLDSSVSTLLKEYVPIDFDSSKDLCMRAMNAQHAPAASKAAAGCLLFQIIDDEGSAGEAAIGVGEKIRVLEDTLLQMELSQKESAMIKEYEANQSRGKASGFHTGDKVEANYCMEGTYYPGVIVEVHDENTVMVKYDDDESTEVLSVENVRSIEPPSELSNRNGPLSDEAALGVINFDEELLFEEYELMGKLGCLLEQAGKIPDAVKLFQSAAEMAMESGKMKTANEFIMRATELGDK